MQSSMESTAVRNRSTDNDIEMDTAHHNDKQKGDQDRTSSNIDVLLKIDVLLQIGVLLKIGVRLNIDGNPKSKYWCF